MIQTQKLLIAALLIVSGSPVGQQAMAQTQEHTAEHATAKTADPTNQAIFDSLITSIEENTYADFQALGDEDVKVYITKEMFEKVVAQVAPRLKKGYSSEYLGNMNAHGFKVHLWKLVFKDGDDDILCELSVKNNRVGGFFLK